MKCTNCGTQSDGNFCPSCGAAMRTAACSSCGAELVAGARFCTRCGAAAGSTDGGQSRAARRQLARSGTTAGASTPSNLPWYIAGGVLVILAVILLLPMITDGPQEAAGPPVQNAPFVGGGAGAGAAPGPLTGTPREQADRLFNRIMTAREAGDTAQVMQFAPMAIQAYAMAEPLDDDGRYHLATVHVATGNYAAAIETAEQILAGNANHLLALGVAAEAAEAAGNTDQARAYYERMLTAWDTESTKTLQEYADHARILPEYQAAARRATGS